MRKLLIGAVAAAYVGAGGTALANGSMKDVVVVEPVPIWSGCYLGGAAGGAWMDDHNFGHLKKSAHSHAAKGEMKKEYDYYKKHGGAAYVQNNQHEFWKNVPSDKFDFSDHSDDSSVLVAALLGCNWERGNFVYGVEGDFGSSPDIDYLASLRGRIGVTWNSALVYLTGGVAFAGFDRDFHLHHDHYHYTEKKFEIDRGFDSDSDETGFVVGGGFEKFLGQNVSFGVEGLYYYFDDDSGTHEFVDGVDGYACDSPCGHYHAFKFDKDVDNEIFVVRARLTYYLRDMPEPLK